MDILAVLTTEASRRTSEQPMTGKSFQVVGFILGNGGHDPNDPTTKVTPDPDGTTVNLPVFGPKAISGYTFANNFCPIVECFLDAGEAVGLFSSLYLVAQVVYSPIPGDPEIGTTFLYAVSHFAQRPKFDSEGLMLKVGIAQ